tara:strand:+ start:143 stop:1264 length:1122 start_codon:yes stop_codon:yes gene_type:complete
MANIAQHQVGMTYAGSYASKIILEPMFRSDDIMRNYTVYPNVKYKQNLMMAPKLSGITALNTGCGTANTCDPAGFSIEQKVITVSNVSVKQVQCWDEFQDQFLVESYKSGLNMPDLTGTQLADVILNRVRHGIQSDVVRNMWAGDTTVGSANTAATCSYRWADGLWKSLSDGNAIIAGSTTMRAVATTTTDETNLVTVGAAIAGSDAITLLTEIFDTASAELQQIPASEKRMFVTPNIYNAYYGALTAVAVNGAVDFGHSEAQSGVNYARLSFRGVELVPMYEWDVAFAALTGADAPALFNHASFTGANKQATQGCIYSAKDNLIIGSNVNDPDTQLKMFYDEVSENMYIRSNFTMGYQYGWNSLVNGGSLVR